MELREAFNQFDLDNDGRITAAELRSAMLDLGLRPTEEEVTEMISQAS